MAVAALWQVEAGAEGREAGEGRGDGWSARDTETSGSGYLPSEHEG